MSGALRFLAACGSGSSTVATSSATDTSVSNQECAHVVDVAVVASGGAFRFDVTVRSADSGWDKYADAWEIRDGADVLGVRELLHPHEDEQPFTRSLSGVAIPLEVKEVTVTARDSVLGFCGDDVVVGIPGRS